MKCCHGADVAAVRGLRVPAVEGAVVQAQVPSVRRRVLSAGPIPAILNAATAAKFDGGIDLTLFEIDEIEFRN